MKKNIYLFLFSVILFSSNTLFAQAKKYPLFEHFTQASCDPCAAQNPAFQAIYLANESNVHHIAYHTSWPGYDPMYDFNPSESEGIVSYYGVTSVPNMILDGKNIGSPENVSEDLINNAATLYSPIGIYVNEVTAGTTRTATIDIKSFGSMPAGEYIVKAVVVEKLIEYDSAPGGNGETEFPNVMRNFLTTTSGSPFVAAAVGGTNTLTFDYELDPIWNEEQIYVLAWVQNAETKEVINSGSTFDAELYTGFSSINFEKGTPAVGHSFVTTITTGATSETISLDVTTQQPGDWTFEYEFDGTTYTDDATISVDANTSSDITIHVTPSSTAAIGEYKFEVIYDGHPELTSQKLNHYLISNITDLIVNNYSAFGDGSPYGTWDTETGYIDGLNTAGSINHGATTDIIYNFGNQYNKLDDIKNIYFNVGWTFPALTKMDVTNNFIKFLDNGGNLFIAGQDIGWEVDYYDTEFGISEPLNFYNDYLHTDFVSDLASGATEFTAVVEDAWYGEIATSAIADVYSSGADDFYFPEQIEANDEEIAFNIFSYNAGTKYGGVRSETETYKTVYLGIGLEMIEDINVRNAVMDATYLYFKGNIDGIAFDNIVKGLLGGAQPNPAVNATTITLGNLDKNYVIYVTDITGKIVLEDNIQAGADSYHLNTSGLNSGMYFYYLTDGQQRTQTEKLNVVK